MEQTELAREVNVAAMKAAPIAGGWAVANVLRSWGPQEWAYVIIGAYTLAQLAYLVWKWRREASAK